MDLSLSVHLHGPPTLSLRVIKMLTWLKTGINMFRLQTTNFQHLWGFFLVPFVCLCPQSRSEKGQQRPKHPSSPHEQWDKVPGNTATTQGSADSSPRNSALSPKTQNTAAPGASNTLTSHSRTRSMRSKPVKKTPNPIPHSRRHAQDASCLLEAPGRSERYNTKKQKDPQSRGQKLIS